MPTPLHNHLHTSTLDGLSTAEEVAQRCQDNNFGAVCITDHDVVAGHVDFYKTIHKAGLKPLLGIETYQAIESRHHNLGAQSLVNDEGNKEKVDNFHLILIAMNNEGLKNLWTMNSLAHTTGFYYRGRVDWELLRQYNKGIIATSACGLGMLSQSIIGNTFLPETEIILQRYLNIFGDRFFIELSTYSEKWQQTLNYGLAKLADEYSVPLVYANDAHYAFPGQYQLHETVLCMQYMQKIKEQTEPHHTPDLYIMNQDQIEDHFFYLPQSIVDEAMDNSDEIARNCDVSLPQYQTHIPAFIPDKQWRTSREMIFDLAVEGYKEKIIDRGLDSQVYMDRFKMEIQVVYEADLYDYFLMIRDIIMWAKEQNYLVGPGRGSVGGSLIAYLIGIHEIDPIRYGLIFERFYNAGRKGSLPDIDIDFPTFARLSVKNYMMGKYGPDHCADIGTVNSLQGRAAIQKLGLTLGIPYSDTQAISKIIEKAIKSGQQPKWEGDRGIWALVGEELEPYKRKHPQLFEFAETMYGRTFTYGVHASGFLVSDVPIAGHFPLRWNAKDKRPVTQFDMRIAEELGFQKIDILGLRNLDTLMMYNLVLDEQKKDLVDMYDIKRMDEDGELPEEMWKLIDDGLTVGIFQIEDGQMAKWLGRHVKPRNLEEIALVTALNRPGPLDSGAAKRYVDAREGNPHPPLHPLVAKVATESYGEIIYQEQLINFFVELGYDPKEADNVRKITGKKLRDEMAKLREDYEKRFFALGADRKAVDEVWHVIEGFADYAFNKAHSVEYGLITLWTLYAKWKNMTEFYLASIKTLVNEGKKGEVPRYVREARRVEIPVLQVDMNKSDIETSIQGNSIRYGFLDVKGIGRTAAGWLVEHRPFENLEDIIAVSQLAENKITLKNGMRKVAVTKGHVERLHKLTELKGEELYLAEEELLGFSLSDNSASILDDYEDEITASCTPLNEIDENGTYTIAGMITNIREAKTKKGQKMAWVTIENGNDAVEFAIWNTELDRLSFVWRRRQAVIAQVKVTDRGKNILNAKVLYSKKDNYARI